MVAKKNILGGPPSNQLNDNSSLPPIGELVISVDDEPTTAPPVTKPVKKGWIKTAKSKASGTLRRTLFGRSTKRRAKDAEAIHEAGEEEEDEEDYTQDNYDTVKSLPASGHYGKSRVGNTSHTKLQDLADEMRLRGGGPPKQGSEPPIPKPPVIIFRVPRKHANSMSSLRVSPGAIGPSGVVKAPLSDPNFDFYTWHTSEADNHDAVYSLFMKAHKCYDLIPTSSKLVVFDTHLPVRKAFYALVYNGVRAAPLWDTDNQRFTGMLTITDFIKILCKHYDKGDNSERIRALEDQQISHWRDQFELDGTLRPFVYIDPNESLHRAVELLCESKVHRLPVLDRKTGNITYILTHKRIMKFLSLYMRDLPRPSFMSCTPRELGIGAWGDILCCHVDTPIHDALELFLKNRVSALPLIDENGRVVDIYAKFDVISLAAESSYDKLDCTVQEALQHRSEWFEGVQTCLETDSLFQVLEAIVKAEVHRLIVTDQDKKVVGVVSLSDILKNLVLDPCQKPPPPPPQSQQAGGGGPPTRNASGTSTGGASSSDSPPHSIPEGIEVEDDDDDDEEAPPPSIDCSTPGPSSAAT
ncbi:CBS domain-containing protein [Caenorhabditis elegans]|uniref:CBS domain-containing protein n=1 Tax=Caenorhabditis elegans TaxID=6239 RepID=Q9BHL6_CAEEL|nr:CBS domain-containing protein [Caenorhabditis elegans]CAC35836.2 CBS domain-containing protein [Caenorhabditis elegans]|eukprot:NP_499637.2 AMP-Activated protein Kinase Gamma subunit [Caenorhabditis elegans]